MSSLAGLFAGLLHATLSLLGFVQANPTLPQATVDQATQVAQQAVDTANNAISQTPATGMKTYTNAQYGFSVQYPNNAPLNVKENPPVLLYGAAPLISFEIPANPNGSGSATVAIAASAKASDIENCMAPTPKEDVMPGGAVASKSVTINNIAFVESGDGSSGLGSYYEHDIYQTLHNNVCYEIYISKTRPSIDPGASAGDSEIAAFVDPILHSFQFASTESSAVAVSGMQKYTDTDFGFSFWYPSNGNVHATVNDSDMTWMYGPGTKVSKEINAPEFTIDEVYSPDTHILGDSKDDPSPVSSYFYYYFDKNAHQWMEYTDGGPKGGPAGNIVADVSRNTMGGLHIFSGYVRFGIKEIIPLSAHNFLVLYAKCNDATDYGCDSGDANGGKAKYDKAVQTILATDPAVATPVSADEQIKTIQAEKDAYASQ